MKTIVTITMNPAIDKSSRVQNVVAEKKLSCKPPRFEPGGGGLNVSRAIKKLGGESILLYPAGGLTGERLKELLYEEGLAHRFFSIEGIIRENLVILEESTDQQYRFGMPGPTLQQNEWEEFLEQLSDIKPGPDYLVASGSLPPGVPADFYAQLARAGKDRGAKVIVDTSGEALEKACKEGAGDSMVAGTVLSLARGKSLKESVMFGVAAGTAAVMTPGTQLCRKEDTERLFETLSSES
ncbi:MAG TPA: PfkB family carbohydrate kinase [Desulfotignum sp.]|nr:PfkB family carbohydrate kinase [Desulfotignum sp.]